MIKERLFKYGGLEVRLFWSEKYGWVTTTPELAKGVGVDRSTLERICKKHNLVMKESVIEDAELGANLHLTTRGGPKPKVFWTIEGMTFVAMFTGTKTSEQFRNEVLKTIKSLEQQGFINNAEVLQRLATLEAMVKDLQATNKKQAETNEKLATVILNQDTQIQQLQVDNDRFTNHEASTAGSRMSHQRWAKRDKERLLQ